MNKCGCNFSFRAEITSEAEGVKGVASFTVSARPGQCRARPRGACGVLPVGAPAGRVWGDAGKKAGDAHSLHSQVIVDRDWKEEECSRAAGLLLTAL